MHHIELTERDRGILRDLWLYRYLDSSQIRRLHFSNAQTARRRLRKLLGLQVVSRFKPSDLDRTGFREWTYRLSARGARIVANEHRLKLEQVRPPIRSPNGTRYMAHHRGVTDFRIWLREGCATSQGQFSYEFLPSYDEIRVRGRRRRRISMDLPGRRVLIPDGVFLLSRAQGCSALFALELDRGTEPMSGSHPNAVSRKLARYRVAFDRRSESTYDRFFSLPFSGFRILCVVPGEPRRQAFLKAADRSDIAPLVWTTVSSSTSSAGDLDAAVWAVAGSDRFHALSE